MPNKYKKEKDETKKPVFDVCYTHSLNFVLLISFVFFFMNLNKIKFQGKLFSIIKIYQITPNF